MRKIWSKAVIDTGTMITMSGTCLMNVFKSFVKANKIELMISQLPKKVFGTQSTTRNLH